MPNHVTNRIQFYGKQENINKVLELIKGEDTCIDFNKIIPMPKELSLPSSSDVEISIRYAISKMNGEDSAKITQILRDTPHGFYGNYYNHIFDRNITNEFIESRVQEFEDYLKGVVEHPFDATDYEGLDIRNFEDLGNTYLRNIIKYGCDTWYDWCRTYWGTKWNAYSTHWDKVQSILEFDTAWSCPLPVLEELWHLCEEHEVYFEGMWADEDGGCNTGYFDSNYYGTGSWDVRYIENGSDEAYEIYGELHGRSNCIGKDEDGHWVHYDCDTCPNRESC